MTKPGPKPMKPIDVEVIDPTLDQDKIGDAAVAMRDQVQAEQLELLELAGDVGALRALEMTKSLVAVATIRIFQKVCESKQINKLPIRLPDGLVATATNIDEFCRLAFNKPRSAMFEASATLEVLGDQAYEAANRLGLNRKQLRLIRSLPDAQRTAVAEAIQAESKSEVVAIIEDLAAQLAQANEDMAQAKLQAQDDSETIADKDNQINQLNTKLKRIDNAEPEEQMALVLAETTTRAHTALAYVRGDLNLAFSKLAGFERAGANSHRHLMAGWLADLEREIAILRADYFLPQAAVTPGTGA